MQSPAPSLSTDQVIAQATAQLRADHKEETSTLQHAVDRLTAVVGMPGFVVVLTLAVVAWVAVNLLIGWAGLRPPDPPPFVWLEAALEMGALYVAALILTTQRRADKLSGQREQLILELAILNDQKTSKLIELLEEVRRDSPTLADRIDHEAHAMSKPADPHSVLGAIKDAESGTLNAPEPVPAAPHRCP